METEETTMPDIETDLRSDKDKIAKKFTLYLRPDSMKQVKVLAIHQDTSYSNIVQLAIEAYLKTP